MKYRLRRPELVPTIFMLITVVLMGYLGVWQLQRLAWKNALIASIEQAQAQAPKDLLSYSPEQLVQAQWHNVMVTGKLLNEKELYAMPRYLDSELGYGVLTPLEVKTSGGNVYVLINRGWVAPANKDPHTRAAGNPAGMVNVSGVVRSGFKKGLFTPVNNPQKNIWFWYDLPEMAKTLGLPLLPVLIDASDVVVHGAPLSVGPKPFPLEIKIRNDHLGYAITWFAIGFIALVMYVVYYAEKKN